MNRFAWWGVLLVVVAGCWQYGSSRSRLPIENSPALSAAEFEQLADALTREERLARARAARPAPEEGEEAEEDPVPPAFRAEWWLRTRSLASPYPHVDYFRKAGIREYRGPESCLPCHGEIVVAGQRLGTLGDVAVSAHGRHQWGGLAVGVAGDGDCLVCHARVYDTALRQPVEREGQRFMAQDRTLRAALTVGKPNAAACLRCHGAEGPGVVHGWSADEDVHARAGLVCTDCHVPVGHRLPGGKGGDLPGQQLSCQGCHAPVAHVSSEDKALFNGHGGVLRCEACHLRKLPEGGALVRGRGGVSLVGHGLRAEGPACNKCHGKQGGLVDFEGLGYAPEKIQRLRHLPELS